MHFALRKPFIAGIFFAFISSLSVALVMAQTDDPAEIHDIARILPRTVLPTDAAYEPGVVLVKFQEDAVAASVADLALSLAVQIEDAHAVSALPNLYAVTVQVGAEEEVAAALAAHPQVLLAEPDYVYHTLETPNDPLYDRYQWNLQHIRADAAWDQTTGSTDVIIAILDTGADLNHPDLVQNLVAGYDFVSDDADPGDDEGHGTHVASIAAATGNNGVGLTGVGWQTKIMPIKVLDGDGRGASSDIAEGIIWAVDHGADVLNLSLGSTRYSETINAAVQYAYGHGVLVVAASGNYYASGNPTVYPAALNNVLAVAAVNDVDRHASYSSSGSYVDLAAPGGDPVNASDNDIRHWIPGAYLRSTGLAYGWLVGTSQAAPHVAGLAALLLAVDPSLTVDQLQSLIKNSAVDIESPGWDELSGYGRVDAAAAIGALLVSVPTPTPSPTATATPAPTATNTPNPVLHTNEELRINSTITNRQSDAAIMADQMGELNVIWRDDRSGAAQIFSARLPVAAPSWGPNFNVTGNTSAADSQSLSAPALGVDGQGNLHAVWLSVDAAGRGTLYHSIQWLGTTAWENLATIDAGFQPNMETAPALTVSADDTLTAAWTAAAENAEAQPSALILWSRRNPNTAQWQEAAPLHVDANVEQCDVVLVDTAQHVYAAWSARGAGTASLKVAALRHDEDSWSSPTTAMPLNPALDTHHPDLAITADGTLVLVWSDVWDHEQGQEIFVISRSPDQGVWTTPTRVNTGSGNTQRSPHLAVSTAGMALVWSEDRDDTGDVFVAWSDGDLAQWTPGRRVNQDVSNMLQEDADVALDAYGNTTVVWSDFRTGDAGPEIYARFISTTSRFQVYLSQIAPR
ncbi:MAG: S8 family peptidase [Caldilineaceae bacterium]